jgi:hypothetical protein
MLNRASSAPAESIRLFGESACPEWADILAVYVEEAG